ncbi:MAG: hypothetical protein AAGA35_00290 [Patescibacteria group bacterium]
MSEVENQEKQEGQKTVVAFVVGLLVGGLLVWVFSAPGDMHKHDDDRNKDEAAETGETVGEEVDSTNETAEDQVAEPETPAVAALPVGDGSVEVADQPAGTSVALSGATYPTSEGWIGVRDYANGQLAGLLGVVRYSEEQGLVPQEIILQRATEAGNEYAVVFYTESGDRQFSLADDVQIDEVFATFTAR